MQIDYKGVEALAAVVQSGDFESAAQKLHITQSAVSQRIKSLESRVGHTLLVRSSPPQPTPAGSTVLKFAQQLEQLEYTLVKELRPGEQQGWVRLAIAVNADSLATWLVRRWLADWCLEHRVLLELKVDDQEQTHHLLQNGSVTGCISGLETPPQGCRSFPLGSNPYLCVASPDYIARWFEGKVTAEKLSEAPLVRFNNKDLLQHQFLSRHFHLDSSRIPTHTVPSSEGFVDWLRLGMGWGMAPSAQVKPWLENGELQELAPGLYLAVPLYWHLWGLDTPLTQSLTTALTQAASSYDITHQDAE